MLSEDPHARYARTPQRSENLSNTAEASTLSESLRQTSQGRRCCSPTSHTMCTPRVGSSATSSGENSIREPEDHTVISRSGTYFYLWLIALTWCSTQVVMIYKMFMNQDGFVPTEASINMSLVLQVWFSLLFVIIVPVAHRATCTDPSDDRGFAPLMTAIWMTLEVEQIFVMSKVSLRESIQSIFALLVSGRAFSLMKLRSASFHRMSPQLYSLLFLHPIPEASARVWKHAAKLCPYAIPSMVRLLDRF